MTGTAAARCVVVNCKVRSGTASTSRNDSPHGTTLGLVQLRWLTTWLDDANDVLAGELGFGQLLVHVHPSPDPEPEMWWKEAVVRDLLTDPHRLVVWCDDQMLRQDPQTGVDQHRGEILAAEFQHRFLPICPDPTAGLQVEHLDEISDFLARALACSAHE